MQKGLRQKRFCKCGCGKLAKEAYHHGRFKGYFRYADGCEFIKDQKTIDARNKGLVKARETRSYPIGSKRIIRSGGDSTYLEIKTKPSGRWAREHRLIIEKIIGRKLDTKEHVHHINGNPSDNRPENLQLLSHSDHSKITAKEHGFGTWDRNKPHKCPCCGILHDPKGVKDVSI